MATAAAAAGEEGRTGGPGCPASVEGDLGAGRARIPCGLAEGAAVTVIGVPREGAARFQVEMVGAGGQVLMHVNVSLGAAGMVVEQNSWAPEEGWGEWERCPPVGDVGHSNSSLQRRLTVLILPGSASLVYAMISESSPLVSCRYDFKSWKLAYAFAALYLLLGM